MTKLQLQVDGICDAKANKTGTSRQIKSAVRPGRKHSQRQWTKKKKKSICGAEAVHNGFQAAKGNPHGFVEEQKVKSLNVPRIEMR